MSTVIKVENISKQYRLGQVGTGSLSEDLTRLWYRIRGKEDPFLKIGQTNDRTKKATHSDSEPKSGLLSRISPLAARNSSSDLVWALKDINFEVKEGEVLGIIGRNGAGKSTLLKILARVTTPTTGSVKVKGRIASLLEVGTGFHPDLTGRENIYLNGAILGMRKHEITRQLDEIIDFSGCDRYIDTPVKRYSSGMYVRLAFAVAAHLDPEILVVDEVLAVGDAEFQKKCLGKMNEVANGGRTVLFVSHNMGAVSQLCARSVILKDGIVLKNAVTSECIQHYLRSDVASMIEFSNTSSTGVTFDSLRLLDEGGNEQNTFSFQEAICLEIAARSYEIYPSLEIGVRIETTDGSIVFTTERSHFTEAPIGIGCQRFQVIIPARFLAPRSYYISIASYLHNQRMFDQREQAISFRVLETGTKFARYEGKNYGLVMCECEWKTVS